ncbi:MAG TPA: heavy metal-binding domain-containing protein [Verrucomicrobiae bacterium]|nr:heavy metal-binding domain-containing protein [Verrucomicrobiae bacterium]
MKKTSWIMVAVLTLGAGVLAGMTGCKSSEHHHSMDNMNMEHAMQYTCPMHPEVVQNSPGKCPKCGMDLVEKH